jgi:hypothetical protein
MIDCVFSVEIPTAIIPLESSRDLIRSDRVPRKYANLRAEILEIAPAQYLINVSGLSSVPGCIECVLRSCNFARRMSYHADRVQIEPSKEVRQRNLEHRTDELALFWSIKIARLTAMFHNFFVHMLA